MADCQCSKCPFHGVKDQETRLKAENKNFTTYPSPAGHTPPPNNNHIHSNHLHPHHIIPPPPTSLHCSLEGAPPDLHSFFLDSSLKHVNYNGYHNNLDGCTEIDDEENSLSDSNSGYDDDDDDDDEDDDDDDDDDASSCSPRRTSQSSDIGGLGLDVPPGSPSSVRSSGDGSSCDTPPVNQCSSSTEDGRTDRGKYCDCCYCEFFGHAAPPVAPTSHNYTEIRDKLRLRLNKRQPHQPVQEKKKRSANTAEVDHRSVDDLLTFINGQKLEEERLATKSKAQKRARQKQKKAAEKAKQNTTGKDRTEIKVVPSSTNGCEKVSGVHHNGTSDVLRNRQLSEEGRKHEIPTDSVKERVNGKPGQRRKAEEQKQKQVEVPDEVFKSRKKQHHANQDVAVSHQASKLECNGKENNFGSRRKSEEKSEKKRQESVSPEPPAPICNHNDEGQDKTDNRCRLPQKKQGKKKKKASLGENKRVRQ